MTYWCGRYTPSVEEAEWLEHNGIDLTDLYEFEEDATNGIARFGLYREDGNHETRFVKFDPATYPFDGPIVEGSPFWRDLTQEYQDSLDIAG